MKTWLIHMRTLFWKNLLLRRRNPVFTAAELLLPLMIALLIVVLRSQQPDKTDGPCFSQPISMSSMGLFKHLQSMLCNFAHTCYSYPPPDPSLNIGVESYLQRLKEMVDWPEYANIFQENLTSTDIQNLFQLIGNASSNFEMPITDTNQPNNVESELVTMIDQIQNFSNFLCGSKINLEQFGLTPILLSGLKLDDSVVKGSEPIQQSNDSSETGPTTGNGIDYCTIWTNLTQNPFLEPYFERLNFFLTGYIYYYPVTSFTTEVMKRATLETRLLIQLKVLIENYQNHTSPSLHQLLANFSTTDNSSILGQLCQNNLTIFCQQSVMVDDLKNILNTLDQIFRPVGQFLACFDLNRKLKPATSLEMFEKLKNTFRYKTIPPGIGIHFKTIPSLPINSETITELFEIAIQKTPYKLDAINFKVLDRHNTPNPRQNPQSRDTSYFMSGFMDMQETIGLAILSVLSNRSDKLNESVNVQQLYTEPLAGQEFLFTPTPCYITREFLQNFAKLLPQLLLFGSILTCMLTTKYIVDEKEQRLKEFTKLMGLSTSMHWIGWYQITFLILLVGSTMTAIILKFGNIYLYTDFFLLLLLFISYSLCLIGLSFFTSTLLYQANLAAVMAGIFYFLLYLPTPMILSNAGNYAGSSIYAWCLSFQVAFSLALYYVALGEVQPNAGAQWTNFWFTPYTTDDFAIGKCILMLWVDGIVFLLLAFYLEAVLPKRYGASKPFYFLFTKQFWCGEVHSRYESTASTGFDEWNELSLKHPNHFEARLESSDELGVYVENLTKSYRKSEKPALDRMTVGFQSNQITSLLGHNGAGKSTLMSILTGMQTPTSGRATVAGYDTREQLNLVRKCLGFCPQYNVLFDRLSVAEHIKFYALLKGMSGVEIEKSIDHMIKLLGFEDKKNCMSKQLSGGQKRKLSISIAFLGQSSVVFLDEPTAGVDPLSRRGIWDLILQLRTGRTIILTTHHMDEADILGDCIAIISQGRLRCYGSSLFLKEHHGHGYYLVFYFKPPIKDEMKVIENEVDLLLQKYIPLSRIVETNPRELVVEIPHNYALNGQLIQFLEHLENYQGDELKHFSLADTSLEEIFISLADDPSNSTKSGDGKLEPDEFSFGQSKRTLSMASSDEGRIAQPVVRHSIRGRKHESTSGLPEHVIWQHEHNKTSTSSQFRAMFAKRFHNFKRHKLGWIIEFIVPVLMVLFIFLFITFTKPNFVNTPLIIHPWWMVNRPGGGKLTTFYANELYSNEDPSGELTSPIESILNVSRLYDQLFEDPYALTGPRCLPRNIFKFEPADLGYCVPVTDTPMKNLNADERTEARLSANITCDCRNGKTECPKGSIVPNPPPSQVLPTTDTLFNLTAYNITDYLMKTSNQFATTRFGGVTFNRTDNDLIGRGILEMLLNPDNQIYSALGMLTPLNGTETPDRFWSELANTIRLTLPPTHKFNIWFNNKGYVAAPAYLNLLQNVQLRWILNSPTHSKPRNAMVFVNHPLDYPPEAGSSAMDILEEISMITFTILALSFVPASLCSFLVYEVQLGAKQLQVVSGLNTYIYWVCAYLWDLCIYTVSAFLCVSVYACFKKTTYVGSDSIGAFMLLLLFYGFAVIPMMYPFSFFIKSPSNSLVILSVFNLLSGCLPLMVVFILDSVSESNESLSIASSVLNYIFMFTPQYCLAGGMYKLSFRATILSQAELYGSRSEAIVNKWENSLGLNVVGDKLIALALQSIMFPLFVLLMERKFYKRHILKSIHHKHPQLAEKKAQRLERKLNNPEVDNALNEDVQEEQDRIIKLHKSNKLTSTSTVAALKLSKVFKRRKIPTVNRLYFALEPYECFGLLGLNGAGKTTTFRMLTGAMDPTAGKVFVNGFDMAQERKEAYRNIGYCPQFDALFGRLTGRETLFLYARLRGTEESEIPDRVDKLLTDMGLAPHADKIVDAYSGGNKRKLSTAIAILGSPEVIFLDEPTSGMDPVGKRFIWDQINALLKAGKSVVLTSHSMEECEALCDRLGIMVNGQFKCVGTVHQLKQRFGNGYTAELRSRITTDQQLCNEKIITYLRQKFPQVFLTENREQCQTYQFPNPVKLSELFKELNFLRETDLIIQYSVRQTTLDQVFVNFTRTQVDLESEDEAESGNELVDETL